MKLIMEQWRRFVEDEEKRQAFAKGLKALGREKENFVQGGREEAILTQLQQGRDLKKVFHKYADRQFLDSLMTVHWIPTPHGLIELLHGQASTRDELSATAYLPDADVQGGTGSLGDFGLVIKGHITLLANDMDQLYSGSGSSVKRAAPERAKMSGANKGAKQIYEPEAYAQYKILVLDEDDWEPYKKRSGAQYNEALVDNWSPIALIVPGSKSAAEFEPETQKSQQLPLDIDPSTTTPKEPEGVNQVAKFEKLLKQAGLDIPVMSSGEFKRQWRQ